MSCPEEIAFRQGWIDAAQLERLAANFTKNAYGAYLLRVIAEKSGHQPPGRKTR